MKYNPILVLPLIFSYSSTYPKNAIFCIGNLFYFSQMLNLSCKYSNQ